MVQTDREALVALYDATDGPNWAIKTNWGSDAPVSDWYGVKANDQGRVVELSLEANNLRGNIPAQLGQLGTLKVLYLFSNNLEGSIPSELGNLRALKDLYLGNNQLSGSIPPELGKLAALKCLSLSTNQLTGHISPELGALSELRQLALSNNKLTGSIPPGLGKLAALLGLDLSNNQLTGPIPSELGNLSALKNLSLGNNQLSGAIPVQLGALNKLEVFDLSINQLSGPIPKELGALSKLEQLWLQKNGLTGSIPPELGKLASLHFLNLSLNQLTGPIPAELGALRELRELWLDNNEITGSIPPELGKLAALLGLDLSNNQLTGSIPVELGELEALGDAQLSGNELSGLSEFLARLEARNRRNIGWNGRKVSSVVSVRPSSAERTRTPPGYAASTTSRPARRNKFTPWRRQTKLIPITNRTASNVSWVLTTVTHKVEFEAGIDGIRLGMDGVDIGAVLKFTNASGNNEVLTQKGSVGANDESTIYVTHRRHHFITIYSRQGLHCENMPIKVQIAGAACDVARGVVHVAVGALWETLATVWGVCCGKDDDDKEDEREELSASLILQRPAHSHEILLSRENAKRRIKGIRVKPMEASHVRALVGIYHYQRKQRGLIDID
eukprot:g4965.t1